MFSLGGWTNDHMILCIDLKYMKMFEYEKVVKGIKQPYLSCRSFSHMLSFFTIKDVCIGLNKLAS